MTTTGSGARELALPSHRGIYFGGAWHAPRSNRFTPTWNPGTGESLGDVADGGADDADAAVAAARLAFRPWKAVAPLERARLLRAFADVVRGHADELA
jgi:betaine-aldehyde dehydrogenase